MNTKNIKMNTYDLLIIDPCYIKHIRVSRDDNEDRFDGLKHLKTLHDGDDGEYGVCDGNKPLGMLGVDSGRIWVLSAEFPVEVEVDSGFSGEIYLENKTGKELTDEQLASFNIR